MPDDIQFVCPSCGQKLEAPADMAGGKVECPTCATPLRVPAREKLSLKPRTQGHSTDRSKPPPEASAKVTEFTFVAMDDQGLERSGKVKAVDMYEAVRQIRESGYFPTRVEPSSRSSFRPPSMSAGLADSSATNTHSNQTDANFQQQMKQTSTFGDRFVKRFWIALAILICAFVWNELDKEASDRTDNVNVVCSVPGFVPAVVSFSGWKTYFGGIKGAMHFHGWYAMPEVEGSGVSINYKAYDSTGTIIASDAVHFPELSPGESGEIKLIGAGLGRAARVVVTIR